VTPIEAVQLARERLESVGGTVVGTVLNDVKLTRNRYFYAKYA
jgi:hypothetical protein